MKKNYLSRSEDTSSCFGESGTTSQQKSLVLACLPCLWCWTILQKTHPWDTIISEVFSTMVHISDRGTLSQPCYCKTLFWNICS